MQDIRQTQIIKDVRYTQHKVKQNLGLKTQNFATLDVNATNFCESYAKLNANYLICMLHSTQNYAKFKRKNSNLCNNGSKSDEFMQGVRLNSRQKFLKSTQNYLRSTQKLAPSWAAKSCHLATSWLQCLSLLVLSTFLPQWFQRLPKVAERYINNVFFPMGAECIS